MKHKLFAVPVVMVLLFVSGVAFAQLRDMDRTSVFLHDIVFIGDPVLETLCHIPPENPANAHTIEVTARAVPAHLAHGDLMGECPSECDGPASSVPQTGQTASWGSRDDGELQMGVPSPDPRFTDNGDGTVKDNLTGLIWLKYANCFGQRDWTNALSAANGLADGSCSLTDGSVAGDWRLPNVKELQSLIDFGQYNPALPPGHLFSGVQSYNYWSSTTYAINPNFAWYAYPDDGYVLLSNKTGTYYVWPVRGGP